MLGLASLGLVQPCVLERDRGVAGKHLEQPDVVLVELVATELRDHDHADHARAVVERHGQQRFLQRLGAGNRDRVVAIQRVPDQERLSVSGRVARDSLADLRARNLNFVSAT